MNEPETSQFEVHDREALNKARSLMNATESPRLWAQAVVEAVKRNEQVHLAPYQTRWLAMA